MKNLLRFISLLQVLLFLWVNCFGEESDARKGWAEVDSLNSQSSANWYSDPEKTIRFAEEALKLARIYKYKRGEAEALNNIGVGYYFSSDYDKVLDYYRRTLKMYEEIGDKEGISKVGTLYFRIAKYQKALESYMAALEIAKKTGDKNQIVQLVSNIAEVYNNLGDYEATLQWYNDLLFNEEQLGDSLNMVMTIEKIGRLFYGRGDYLNALGHFKKLYTLNSSLNSKIGQASALNQLGSTFFMMKNYNNADSYFHQSLLIQKELNDEFGMTTNMLNLGRLNLALKRLNESLLWAQKAVDLSRKNHEQEQLREGLKLLALIQSDLKNYPEAFRAQLEYSTILEKRNIQEQNDQLANTLVLYELGQKKQENEILLARNENYRLSIEKQSLNKWRISLGVTILLVVIAIGVIVYRYNLKRKENKRLEAEVRQAVFQQQQQQKIIFHQSSLTSLGELAAGIAHEINQPIQNISLSSEIIRDELSANDYNKKFVQKTVNGIFEDIDRIRGIIDHIRIFSSGQKEGIVEYFNPDTVIADSLKMIRQQMINRGIILKEEYNTGSVLLLGNPHKFEQVIINLLSNSRDALAEKADKARNIEIYTSIKENLLIVKIYDNGLGINPDKLTDIFLPFYTTKKLGQGTGLGLSIAHGIIAQMNGRIIPDSKLNEGTTMRIELPIVNQNVN